MQTRVGGPGREAVSASPPAAAVPDAARGPVRKALGLCHESPSLRQQSQQLFGPIPLALRLIRSLLWFAGDFYLGWLVALSEMWGVSSAKKPPDVPGGQRPGSLGLDLVQTFPSVSSICSFL